MPEPRPFFHDPTPPASAGAKPAAEQCVLFSPSLSLVFIAYLCRSRRQYNAEPFGNGTTAPPAERPPPRGLPGDPRPGYKTPVALRAGNSGGSTDARSPSPASGHTRGANSAQYPLPIPDVTSSSVGLYGQPWNASPAGRNGPSNGVQTPGSAPQRQPSYRPPGASAPRIPGHAIGLDSQDDSTNAPPSADHHLSLNNPSDSNSYFPSDATYSSNLFNIPNIPPPPPLNSHSHVQAPSRPNHDSSDDILAHGSHGFARPLSHSEFSYFFFQISTGLNRRYPLTVSSSERPLRSTSTVSTSSSTRASGLERNFTTSTVATMSTAATTYSSTSRDKETITERTPVDRSDSFTNKFREPATGPVAMSERQPSEPARSVGTARSHLATEIKRLKSQEAREDATNSYDDDYYDDDEDYYSDEESLDSFVNFSLLSNIAVWMRDQVPRGTHVKGSIPYPRAFTGKDIVVCAFIGSFCATFDLYVFIPVHTPVAHRLRAPHQPRYHDKQSLDRAASCARPPAAAIFL